MVKKLYKLRKIIVHIFAVAILMFAAVDVFAAGFQTSLSITPSSKTCSIASGQSTCDIKFTWSTFYNGGAQGGHTSTDKRVFKFNGVIVSSSSNGSYTAKVPGGTSTYDLRETGSSSALFSGYVTATLPPLPPVTVNDSASTNEDAAKSIAVLSNDSDPNSDTFSIHDFPQGPSHGTVGKSGTSAVYTPTGDYCGSDSFKYRAIDSGGLISNEATVNLSVNCINDAPSAVGDNVSTNEDTAKDITVLANDSDKDGDSFTIYDFPLSPSHGSVGISGNYARYTPSSNYCGSDSFSYRIKDSKNAVSNSATVSINVICVADAPVINQGSNFTAEAVINIPVNFTLSASDVDSSSAQLVWSIVAGNGPTLGVLSGAGSGSSRNFIYTPSADVLGNDTFKIQVSDGSVKDEILISLTISSPKVKFTYDSLGRLREVKNSYGRDGSYEYDAAGNRNLVAEE